MFHSITHIPDLSNEFIFKTSRSSGSGGQHVNKVNTKVELRFNIAESKLLGERQIRILLEKLQTKLSQDGFLIIVSQRERSQLMNKEEVIRKCYELLEKALKPVKKRRATRPTRSSKERRIQGKKQKSEKKSLRGKIDF